MSSAVQLDEAFLARLRRRDPEVLERTVKEHARPLYRAARALGFSHPESEDLVQDVFTTFLETLERFEGRSQVRTWLFGILHHKVFELRRAHLRQEQTDDIDEVFESRFDTDGKWVRPPVDLQRLIESQQIGEVVGECLEALPVNLKEAFVLREIEEFETPEICKILGISVTNINVMMHRARNRLRECVEKHGWKKA